MVIFPMEKEKKQSRRERILTQPVLPLLIKTAIPTIIGMLINMVYNLTDTFFIGQLNNKSMTAAIGIVFSFVSFIQAVGFWFGYGSGNSMSRKLGEQDDAEAKALSSSGIVMALGTGIVLMVLLSFLVEPLARLLGGSASAQLLTFTTEYLRIIIFSIPFSLFALTVYNQLRLCGNVKDGMLGLLAGMLSNMILDPILIFGFNMGFIGAGWATFVGQVIGSITLFILSGKHGNIPVSLRTARFTKERIYHILAGGAPNFSRQGITSIANVLLNIVAARYGEATIAALTVSSRIAALAYMIVIGWGQGFQPICAMNYGAKQYGRVKQALRLTLSIGTVFLIFATALLAVFASCVTAVLSRDPEVIRLGAQILCIQCTTLPFMGFYAISSMYMQNIGQYSRALWISIARQGFFYIPLLFLLPVIGGQLGLFWVQPAADFLSVIFAGVILWRYHLYTKKSNSS